MNRSLVALASLPLLVATLSPARAEGQARTAAPAKVKADDARARELFQEAQLAYSLGEFQKAMGLYSEAYRLKPLPGFLYNIAQCYRQLGDFKQAGFAYGRFIDASRPDAPNVDDARQLQKLMEEKQAEKEALAKAAKEANERSGAGDSPALLPGGASRSEAAASSAPPKPWYKQWWVWTIVGVAVAGGATGLAVGLQPKAPAQHTSTAYDYALLGTKASY
jgi:tetratricopeptide (TPR) repeat protein